MALRKIPLITGQIYHVFNRGIDRRPTFINSRELSRAYQILKFYRFVNPPVRLSRFLELSESRRSDILKSWEEKKLVSIFSYCLMPNHFHLLLRQETENGISKFVGQFLNSYTKYFNTKNKRVGGLFLDEFKNVLVESEAQLLHLSRYIHLNPHTSFVVRNFEELLEYKWSSLGEYLGTQYDTICDKEIILSSFKNKEAYKNFILDNASYQRELKLIENLVLDD